VQVSSHKKLETPKHDCEIPEAVEHEEVAAPRCPKGPLPQRDLSPLGEACSRMNMTAIHEILVNRHYRDDDLDPNVVRIHWRTQHALHYCKTQLLATRK
jgi:hypothetical protein